MKTNGNGSVNGNDSWRVKTATIPVGLFNTVPEKPIIFNSNQPQKKTARTTIQATKTRTRQAGRDAVKRKIKKKLSMERSI